jgi:hypothetical protein
MPEVCWVPLHKDKFEVCCVPDDKSHHACWRDASEEVIAEFKDGKAYYLPVCNNPDHLHLAEEAKKKLMKGVSIEELSKYVVKQQVFLKPSEILDRKCKIIQWEVFQKRKLALPPEAIEVPTVTAKKKTAPPPEAPVITTVHKAAAKWEWIDGIGRWMNIKGKIESVSSLSDKELRHTAIAIRDANFQKISKNISWTKELRFDGDYEGFSFPEDALKVGSRVAVEKLEDFRIECKRRGYF